MVEDDYFLSALAENNYQFIRELDAINPDPRRSDNIPKIDWEVAVSSARCLSSGGPMMSVGSAQAAVADMRAKAEEAVGLTSDYTGMELEGPAPIHIVDRATWATKNIIGLESLLEQATGGMPPVTGIGGRILGAQTGAVVAFLSPRVLGQFEPFGTPEGSLMFNAPNIVSMENKMGISRPDFRLWVAIHESCHLLQFRTVSWMHQYFVVLVSRLLAEDWTELGPDSESAGDSGITTVTLTGAEKDLGLLGNLINTPQRAALSQIQALMSLLEGHAEAVMDGLGTTVIPSMAQLRQRFNHQRSNPGTLAKLMRSALGLDIKMRQYVTGRRFVDAVIAADGLTGFNRVWDHPDNLPTLEEIHDPDKWRNRVRA